MTHDRDAVALRLEGAGKTYRQGPEDVVALAPTDLSIHTGQFVAVMGPERIGEVHAAVAVGRTGRPLQWRGLRERVQNWPPLRANGFGLGIEWDGVDVENGELRRSDSRRAVLIPRSGVVTAAAAGSPDFLGWASHQPQVWDSLTSVIINPFVIVEFTLELVRFVYEAIAPELAPRTRWRFLGSGRHLQGRSAGPSLALRLGTSPHFLAMSARPPIADNFDESIDAQGDDPIEQVSYRLLAEVLGSGWGVKHDDVPFAEAGRIDLDEFSG